MSICLSINELCLTHNYYKMHMGKVAEQHESNVSTVFFLSHARNHTGTLFHAIEKGQARLLCEKNFWGKDSEHRKVIEAFQIFESASIVEKEKICHEGQENILKVRDFLNKKENETFKNRFKNISGPLNAYNKFILQNEKHPAAAIRSQTTHLFEHLINTLSGEKQTLAKKLVLEMVSNSSHFVNRIDTHKEEKNKYLKNYVICCEAFVNLLFEEINDTEGVNKEKYLSIKNIVTLAITSAGFLLTYEKKSFWSEKLPLFVKQAFAPLTLLLSTALDTIAGHFSASVVIGSGLAGSICTPLVFAVGGFLVGMALVYAIHWFADKCYKKSVHNIKDRVSNNIHAISKEMGLEIKLEETEHKTGTIELESRKQPSIMENLKKLSLQSITGLNESVEQVEAIELSEVSKTNRVRSTISDMPSPSHLSSSIPVKPKISLFRDGPTKKEVNNLRSDLKNLDKKVENYFLLAPASMCPGWYKAIEKMKEQKENKECVHEFIEFIYNKSPKNKDKIEEIIYLAHHLGNHSDDMSRTTIIEYFKKIQTISLEISKDFLKDFNETEEINKEDIVTFFATYLSSSVLYLSYNKRPCSHKFWRYLFIGIVPAIDSTLEGISMATGDLFEQVMHHLGKAQLPVETLVNVGIAVPIIAIGVKIILWALRLAKKKDKTGIQLPNKFIRNYVVNYLEKQILQYKLTLNVANKFNERDSKEEVKLDTEQDENKGTIKQLKFKLTETFKNKICAFKILNKENDIYTFDIKEINSLKNVEEGYMVFPHTHTATSIFTDELLLLEDLYDSYLEVEDKPRPIRCRVNSWGFAWDPSSVSGNPS